MTPKSWLAISLFALPAFGGATILLHAAPAGVKAVAPAPASQVVSYDAGAARWLNAPRTVEMSQGVTFSQGDAFLKTIAATVLLDDQQRALNAKSATSVHLYDTQNDLTGSQGFIDFTRHLVTLRDNIVLVVKPGKPSPGSVRTQFKDAATMTCALMTYDYRSKVGRVPGTLTVHQKDRILTADQGEYDTRAQVVTLTGSVHGRNGDGEINAPLVVMGLKEGEEYIKIPGPHVTGVFNVPNGDDNTPPTPQSSGEKKAFKVTVPAASPVPPPASSIPPAPSSSHP